jgi:hypothetical protein
LRVYSNTTGSLTDPYARLFDTKNTRTSPFRPYDRWTTMRREKHWSSELKRSSQPSTLSGFRDKNTLSRSYPKNGAKQMAIRLH